MKKEELREAQQRVIEKLDTVPLVRAVRSPNDPDPDDARDLIGKLKTLSEIEIAQREIDLKEAELGLRAQEAENKMTEAQMRHAEVAAQLEAEERKSKRDLRGKLAMGGVTLAGGYGAILLTGLLESDKLIRSKAWQFASKIASKIL